LHGRCPDRLPLSNIHRIGDDPVRKTLPGSAQIGFGWQKKPSSGVFWVRGDDESSTGLIDEGHRADDSAVGASARSLTQMRVADDRQTDEVATFKSTVYILVPVLS
jgi:hypothetical protein